MPKKACELLIKTLQEAQYHVMTPQGLSNESYRNTPEAQIHGPGQGNRCAPSLWVTVSSILMECMARKSEGMTLHDPEK